MPSNLKGWIGFLVITIIIIGGAFGTSHILKTSTSGTAISGITASGVNGYYDSANQTYVANVTQSTSNVTFSISMTLTSASGALNISVVSPAIENLSAFNSTFTTLYNKIYNDSVNQTLKNGGTLNATVNASLAENATILATTYAHQNLTYSMFPSFSKDVSFTGGVYTFNLTVELNATAFSLITSGQQLSAVVNAAVGSSSANAIIVFSKV